MKQFLNEFLKKIAVNLGKFLNIAFVKLRRELQKEIQKKIYPLTFCLEH